MIEKIEILQHSEGSDLSSHSCEETLRFLCIVSYHHELVVKLGKDRLNPLPETLMCNFLNINILQIKFNQRV